MGDDGVELPDVGEAYAHNAWERFLGGPLDDYADVFGHSPGSAREYLKPEP